MNLLLKFYDWVCRHRTWGLSALVVLTALLALALTGMHYEEDISRFLPVEGNQGRAMEIYQDIARAGQIVVMFKATDSASCDPDDLTLAVDLFAEAIEQADTTGLAGSVTAQVDLAQMEELTNWTYEHVPYLLTADDYQRMDSLLATEDFIATQLQAAKAQLMLPSAGMLAATLPYDPLSLFTLHSSLFTSEAGSDLRYELYDGHIFSPDMERALVLIRSPWGSSETEHNAALLSLLQQCADEATNGMQVEARFTGGPVIAVDNAARIKQDSLWAVLIAVVLIVVLLWGSLRSVRNLLLIALTVGWGWLFAMGLLALLSHQVSLIVIGISSVVLGIAVNYPLHYIAHTAHTPNRRQALREIVAPLVVGNITTVGAFLTLVPLRAIAMRDLGLFASLLLVGTILFAVLCLPHLAQMPATTSTSTSTPHTSLLSLHFLDRLAQWEPRRRSWGVVLVAVLTIVFAWLSRDTQFDANMSHINYLSPVQQENMSWLQRTMSRSTASSTVYAVCEGTSWDEALQRYEALEPVLDSLQAEGLVSRCQRPGLHIPSQRTQAERLKAWREWVERHADLPAQLALAAEEAGFAAGTFEPFTDLLAEEFTLKEAGETAPLQQSALLQHEERRSVVTALEVDTPSSITARVKGEGVYAFDIAGLGESITGQLSDNFNYIGWACGFIVFLFLWLSLGSVELAIISFIPMAVSWVWILGIMALVGIQFNIVNIILATFIFGQGDDYTIFMTEGAVYEYAYRRRMLPSYKRAIILSALIMFIGIGALIFAKHPALRSLAEVTICGMLSVVLMAWLLPPWLFGWMVKKGDHYRTRPLSLSMLLPKQWRGDEMKALVIDRYRYRGAGVMHTVRRSLRHTASTTAPKYGGAYGELALLHALAYPDVSVLAVCDDPDTATLLRHCAEGVANNLTITDPSQAADMPSTGLCVCQVGKTPNL